MTRAIAVFHNFGGHCLDPLLKRGFRHVFIAVETQWAWLVIDAMEGRPEVREVCRAGEDLAKSYRDEGFEVVSLEVGDARPRLPFAYANCVGMAKAFLGVRSWAVTPFQLYKYLKRKET